MTHTVKVSIEKEIVLFRTTPPKTHTIEKNLGTTITHPSARENRPFYIYNIAL